MKSVFIATASSLTILLAAQASTAAPPVKPAAKPTPTPGLTFFRFEIQSEKPDSWQTLTKADAASGTELLGLFAEKKNPKVRLMAFRKSDFGYKVCDAEKNLMRKNKTQFSDLKPVKGWACLFKTKDRSIDRLIGIRTYLIKGKALSTPFSLVIATDSIEPDRFLKMASSLKETL